jgi:outer membrane protein OmpA-like peptidoglycan-associated protein
MVNTRASPRLRRFSMLGMHAAKKDYLRFATVLALALSAGGCSTMSDAVPSMPSVPDWVDPGTWFGGDDSSSSSSATPAPTSDNSQPPDLASLPDKPQTTTPDDQQKVASTLAASADQAKYSADALRGGTEAAAAPPPNVAPAEVADADIPAAAPPPSASKPAPVVQQADLSVASAPEGQSAPGTLPAPAPGPVQVASVAPPPPAVEEPLPAATPAPAAAPAPEVTPAPAPAATPVAARAPAPMQVASIAPSDAALGFKPSTAPALDPTVTQFVAPTIVARYDETASEAGIGSQSPMAVASAKPVKYIKSRKGAPMGEGGPEAMTGAVVANLDAIDPGAGSAMAPYANASGMTPSAVVFFHGDTVGLSASAREQIRAAAEQYRGQGSVGFVRVVGHSSSRTANMPLEKHLEVIFRKSQDRADAVAKELIRDGVPADKVLISAVGDSQPVYYESMPKGEDGNRRAEIFLQG